MTVHEALRARFSCRSFLAQEVPQDLLQQVLQDAFCAPSCENSQPWEVYVAGPKAMEQIRKEFEACRKAKVRADLDHRFDGRWTEGMKPRIDAYFEGIYQHEPGKNRDYTLQKRNLFYAPVMVYLCMDSQLPTWSVFDIGLFAQSLMLSAAAQGLATMASAVSVSYPDALHRILGIPENQRIFIGIGIGYPDWDAKVNQFKSSRKPITEVVYKGVRSISSPAKGALDKAATL